MRPVRILALAAVVLAAAPAFAQDSFPDVPANHWAYEALLRMKGDGLLVGYPDGLFRGGRPASRYELAVAMHAVYTNLKNITDGLDAQLKAIPTNSGTSQAEVNALKDAVAALQADLAALKGYGADIADLRRASDTFEKELTQPGVDVQAMKDDLATSRVGSRRWRTRSPPLEISGDSTSGSAAGTPTGRGTASRATGGSTGVCERTPRASWTRRRTRRASPTTLRSCTRRRSPSPRPTRAGIKFTGPSFSRTPSARASQRASRRAASGSATRATSSTPRRDAGPAPASTATAKGRATCTSRSSWLPLRRRALRHRVRAGAPQGDARGSSSASTTPSTSTTTVGTTGSTPSTARSWTPTFGARDGRVLRRKDTACVSVNGVLINPLRSGPANGVFSRLGGSRLEAERTLGATLETLGQGRRACAATT